MGTGYLYVVMAFMFFYVSIPIDAPTSSLHVAYDGDVDYTYNSGQTYASGNEGDMIGKTDAGEWNADGCLILLQLMARLMRKHGRGARTHDWLREQRGSNLVCVEEHLPTYLPNLI